MRFWWVNQNQTHREEQRGGYLWSPVRKSDGSRNPYYESMKEVSPGDLVLCYFQQRIQAIGIALSYCFDAPKPLEFGSKGSYWQDFGHRILVRFLPVPRPVRPKAHIEQLRPLLPDRYSPLRPQTGDGLQNLYLTRVSKELGTALLAMVGCDLGGLEAERLSTLRRVDDYDGASVTAPLESDIIHSIREAPTLAETVKQSVIQARVGQGPFRFDVLALEGACRVTDIRDPVHLIASHIKPWRSCADARERLDGNNGLALAPHVDHLFDKGFLSFEENGEMLLSPILRPEVTDAFGIDPSRRVAPFRDEQGPYLTYHRTHVLRRAM